MRDQESNGTFVNVTEREAGTSLLSHPYRSGASLLQPIQPVNESLDAARVH
jgi:hypothetical protein